MDKIAKAAYRPPFRLYGGGTIRENPHAVAEHYGLEVPIIRELMEKYGTRYQDVLKLVESDPQGHEKLSEDPPVMMAQVVYSVKVEMARTVQDVVERRLGLCYCPAVPEKCLKTIDEYIQRISEE